MKNYRINLISRYDLFSLTFEVVRFIMFPYWKKDIVHPSICIQTNLNTAGVVKT